MVNFFDEKQAHQSGVPLNIVILAASKLFDNTKMYLKGLASEIYLAESGINRQVTLKGRGSEVFRGFCPSPLMQEAL
jgi:hypothetical protein